MSYNFLKEARSITNSYSCRYDTLNGYISDFKINGDVDGWDVYYNTYLYGSWKGTLFGTAFDRGPYIGRTSPFSSIEAEVYYYVKILMKITNNNPNKAVGGLTTGKVRWTTTTDGNWNADKELEFDLIIDDTWRLYTINVGPAVEWVGYINNLRIYPFIDGWSGDQFAIKFIKISSLDTWTCSNTQCSYYLQYEHDCPGAGTRGSSEAGISRTRYTTTSGVNDRITVNIDDYGDESFDLGTNENVTGIEMAKVIGNKLGTLSLGGYSYATIVYSETDRIKITSGTTGTNSSVVISNSSGAEELGFFSDSSSISDVTSGAGVATGFDYASSRLLASSEINKLVDGNKTAFSYIHNPKQYNVEGGRRDFNQVGISTLTSDIHGNKYFDLTSNRGKTLLDLAHPFDNNGKVKAIYVYGNIFDNAKIKICRPHSDGEYTVIESIDITQEDVGKMYTTLSVNYRIDCDVLVSKGDFIGIYDVDIYVGKSLTGVPDATYVQYNGEALGRFDPGNPYSLGVAGFSVYGRGDRWQTNTIIDIDLNNRVNIEQINVYGSESDDYFEFNIMSCLDVSWEIDTFGGTHRHIGYNWNTGQPFADEHVNYIRGTVCLDDMITTPDNGNAGDSLESNSGAHSYCYITGDAEWIYGECNGKYEYCWPNVPEDLMGYTNDPVAYTVYFPEDYSTIVHKCAMYFKEQQNFRSFALSYYLGPYDSTGNADLNSFKYIPSFNAITLDGLRYDETNNDDIDSYLFRNPCNGALDVDDIDQFLDSIAADWTIIEHEFDDVECRGFRIYCNQHYSTKITELELYGKLESDQSLSDNLIVSFSDYGEMWASTSFSSVSSNQISSFVGGAPRYFKLEIEASTEFELNEIEFLVGDQFKLEDCEDNVLLENTSMNAISQPTSFDVENVYDKPFDLYVDLPREISGTSTGLVFWSKLGSQDEIRVPEIGPGCILHKPDDYLIANDNGQCAINCQGYGLKNLIHEKQAYLKDQHGWEDLGTLSSGISISHLNKSDIKKRNLEFSGVSNKYWKLTASAGSNCIIDGVATYYSDVEEDITTLASGTLSDTHPFYIDLYDSNALDKIVIYKTGTLNDVSVWISTDGVSYVLWDTISASDENYYQRLVIDLEKRHDLDIIRNYGTESDKLFISTSSNVDYSNSDTSDADSVSWDNSTKDDARWVRISMLCGDGTARSIGKLGVYPDIGTVFCIDGGYNCEWEDLGLRFTYYNTPLNVAYGANTSGTNSYAFDWYPDNAVDGVSNEYTTEASWGFEENDGEDPYLELTFDEVHTVNKAVLYHGLEPTNDEYMNNDYNLLLASSLFDPGTFVRAYGNLQHISGIFDNCMEFNGTSDYLTAEYTESFNLGRDDFTIDCWVKFNTLSETQYILQRSIPVDGDSTDMLALKKQSDNTIQAYLRNGAETQFGLLTSSDTMASGIWHHIAYVRSDNYFRLFIDGIQQSNVNEDGYLGLDETTLNIGRSSAGSSYMDGCIDELRIINEATWSGSGNYTTATGTYSMTDSTILLLHFEGEVFLEAFSETGNSNHEATHQFTPMEAIKARLTITDYDSNIMYILDPDTGDTTVFTGSFLKEIEIYTHTDIGYVNSELWPVVCINLQDQFNVLNHALINKDITDTATDWDNDEEFFKYSDNVLDDPKKVTFTRSGTEVNVYSSTDTSGDRIGYSDYIFDDNVYIPAGMYKVSCQIYDADSTNEISLRLDGNEIIDVFPEITAGGSWQDVNNFIEVQSGGFYTVKGYQHLNVEDNWGVRYPRIYRTYGLSKWVAVRRDTAEGYSYNDDPGKYGKDYLSLVKVFGDTRYKPTEHSWWWSSTLSSISNDYLIVNEDVRSLKIEYPASSESDTVSFSEGDDFGQDIYWSVKDFLGFYMYVDDISRLDTSYGDVTFGVLNDAVQTYYTWNIENMNLSNGWNHVRLKFEDRDASYPAVEDYYSQSYMEERLDFRTNNIDMSSLRLRYRGIGQPFTIYITDMNIERNIFDEDVKFGKGICLNGHDYLEIPLNGLTLEKGTIEFWTKPYYDSYGIDIFGVWDSRTMFTITNNNNNIVALAIKSGNWLEFTSGHVRQNCNAFTETDDNIILQNYIEIDTLIHIAVSWSNDGTGMDNNDTFRFYLNGVLAYISKVTWEVSDTKFALIKFGGGHTQLVSNHETFGGGVFDNVKIYDYCKSDFNINVEGIEKDISHFGNEFVELSSDSINFYGLGSANIPIIFQQIPAGEKRTIYIRSNKNENFKRSTKTASIIISWLTSV